MDLSQPPKTGEVIHYAYLWRDEHRRGLDEGRKPRPSAVVLAKKDSGTSIVSVLVMPISHSPPSNPSVAIEISDAEKDLIGLDDDPQWIICNEINQFDWPGFDIRPKADGSHTYGLMPPGLFKRAKALLLQLRTEGATRNVDRR